VPPELFALRFTVAPYAAKPATPVGSDPEGNVLTEVSMLVAVGLTDGGRFAENDAVFSTEV